MQIAPPDRHLARHARLREDLRAGALDALVITSLPNIAYLTGLFASTAALVASADRVALVVDGRYLATAQARARELGGLEIVRVSTSSSQDECLAAEVRTFAKGRVGFEAAHMTVKQHDNLRARLAAADIKIEMAPTEGLVEAPAFGEGRLGAGDAPGGRPQNFGCR